MRKRIISSVSQHPQATAKDWLDLERLAQVEVTSEDSAHPVEAALVPGGTASGWRAAEPGAQTLRLLFDVPQGLGHVQLEFTEPDTERTQEFVLRYSTSGEAAFREILRQQWTFSPQGATSELEDYQLELPAVTALELVIIPDISGGPARASLTALRLSGLRKAVAHP